MVIPTAISIFLAVDIKRMSTTTVDAVTTSQPQIVCFDPDVCALKVLGTWYSIDGIIKMEETVPEEYRLYDPEPEPEPEVTKSRRESLFNRDKDIDN
jgi:hypothetical protein